MQREVSVSGERLYVSLRCLLRESLSAVGETTFCRGAGGGDDEGKGKGGSGSGSITLALFPFPLLGLVLEATGTGSVGGVTCMGEEGGVTHVSGEETLGGEATSDK